MQHALMTMERAAKMIASGKTLLLAGSEELLGKLPRGNWIGGTTSYFMTEDGGICSTNGVFCTELPEEFEFREIRTYDSNSLDRLYTDAPGAMATFILIPAMSAVHLDFALRAPELPEFGMSPLVGWVAGVHLNDLGKESPRVFSGLGHSTTAEAVVLRIGYDPARTPVVEIINLFEPGDGPAIEFPSSGFSATTCHIDGREELFSEYVMHAAIDGRLPLVANVGGALVNVSLQTVDRAAGNVSFYGPVFTGVEYRVAGPIDDYEKSFETVIRQRQASTVAFSCNCILNYLYSFLEGKKLDRFPGPFTFGEIAYQLVNQTLVSLELP